MMPDLIKLPESFQNDIHRAVEILKTAGCNRIYLFGSLAAGQVSVDSDIDIAIQGCPPGKYFYLLGRLLLELEHSVDIVNLDKPDAFARYLETEGELRQIG